MISSLLSLIYANLRASWRKYILTGLGIAIAAFFLERSASSQHNYFRHIYGTLRQSGT